MTIDKTSCQTCTFLLASESSETQFRCGIEYFSQPPSIRQAQKMRNYRPVQPSDSCGQWQKHAPSVLSDKFTWRILCGFVKCWLITASSIPMAVVFVYSATRPHSSRLVKAQHRSGQSSQDLFWHYGPASKCLHLAQTSIGTWCCCAASCRGFLFPQLCSTSNQ